MRMAAHPPHGETILPSTSTLQEPSNQPQKPSVTVSVTAPASGQLERMQVEVLILQQQAQATQQSLKKLQARESASRYSAIVSDLPRVFSSVDSTALGIGSGLVLAALAAWWYAWHRPRTRWIDAPRANTNPEPPISTSAALFDRNVSLHAASGTQPPSIAVTEDARAWDRSTLSGDIAQPYESGHSPFARHEPNREFDPEAAASEVTRVRKSLADKREARSQLRDREDSVSAALDLDLDLDVDVDDLSASAATPSVRAWLDGEIASRALAAPAASTTTSDLDLDLGAWQPPQAPIAQPEPEPVAEESVSFSLAEYAPLELDFIPDAEPAAETIREPLAEPEPEPGLEPELDLALEAEPYSEPDTPPQPLLAIAQKSTPMSNTEHAYGLPPAAAPESGSKHYDFTITLALAQESATLELWNEARDLASEVLESDDPKLVSEALSLLERLNQMELEAPVDTSTGNGAR